MTRCSFVACVVGDADSVRAFFGVASGAAAAADAPRLSDARADVVVRESNGDVIEASYRGHNALPQCDAVVLVCDSGVADSVRAVHALVGRAGGDAPSLPGAAAILLLDLGGFDDADRAGEFADMSADLESVVRFVGSAYLDPEAPGRPGGALESLTRMAGVAVRCPRHMLWDGRSLTEDGRRALRRSFWLLDEDGDGALNDGEISRWHRAMYGAFSTDDVSTIKAYARNTESSYIAAGTAHARNRLVSEDDHVTVLGYLAVCHIMLAEGRHEPLWVMLSQHGIGPDALPYTDDEIERAVASDDAEAMLHLSPSGVSFFASLYARQRCGHPSDLFLFTPDCPWAELYGLPNASEIDLPVHDFVSCWRFMAVVDPTAVARFARYWAFAPDLATLFAEGKMRPFRRPGDAPPPTAVYLVLGAPQSGKTSLMQRVADHDAGTVFADDVHPSGRSAATATVRARANNDGDMLLALRELDESEVDATLSNARFMDTVSGVLVCFDTAEPYSLSYLSRVYPRIAACPGLPVVLAMCKADLPVADQLGLAEGARDFCLQRGIMWPPVFASLSPLRALPGGLLNDVDNLTFILAEVAVNPDLVRGQMPPPPAAASASSAAGPSPARPAPASTAGSALRTLKRVVVVAAAAFGIARLAAYAWRHTDARERLPAALVERVDAANALLDDGVSAVSSACAHGVRAALAASGVAWREAGAGVDQRGAAVLTAVSTQTTTGATVPAATTKHLPTPASAVEPPPLTFSPALFYAPVPGVTLEPEHYKRVRYNESCTAPKRTWVTHAEWH
jgi:hypothetical protein